MKQYVACYRVFTAKQGHSGLGLEAWRTAVEKFVHNRSILQEFVEVESGKVNNRPQLVAAIDYAKARGATLVIARPDRLSHNAGFIFTLKDSGADFVCADMPDANTLTIGIFAVLAQHERELISGRTKAALVEKIRQGNKPGTPANLTRAAWAKGQEWLREKALGNENNRRAEALITVYRQQGKNWLTIAGELNKAGFRTARGKQFQAVQVQRIHQRTMA